MFPIYIYSISIIILTLINFFINGKFNYLNQISILIFIISLINNYISLLDVEIILFNGIIIENCYRIFIKIIISFFIFIITLI